MKMKPRLANSPSVKFTLRMSHAGWVLLELFVPWCLHLFLQNIDPGVLPCWHKTVVPELKWSAALSSLKCASDPVKNAAWMKGCAVTSASSPTLICNSGQVWKSFLDSVFENTQSFYLLYLLWNLQNTTQTPNASITVLCTFFFYSDVQFHLEPQNV